MADDTQPSQRRCRSVLVTGSNRGIGLGLVEGLAALKYPPDHVIASCRDPAGAQELRRLSEKYSNIRILQLDILCEESRQAAVQQVEALLGEYGLNCLINNAGINIGADLDQVTSENMLQNYEANTVAQLMVTKSFLPLLRRAAQQETGMGWHRASIINMSSDAGSMHLAEELTRFCIVYPYRLSKAALNMVTRSLAVDLKSDGILCMSLHPGWVKTDMGTCYAPMQVADIIPSVISLLGRLSEKDNGSFLDWNGDTMPW